MELKHTLQKKKVVFLALLFFLSITTVIQAQSTITGTVLDAANGSSLIGASILEKGTSNGTITDIDGTFSLSVEKENAILIISYLGYSTQEVAATSSVMNISLGQDQTILDEVVVVGYGVQKKSDLVSAVATTDLEKAVLTPTSDVNEMLRGRIAGLQVDVGSGTLRPGGTSDILFRGRSSIEGNVSGIYVVDGIVRSGGIEDINPDDIESIEFLKDASAQAIYGSRAVNGVVLITTKRGKSEKVSVSYHGFLSTKTIERNFDVYDGQEFAQLRREATRTNNGDGTEFLPDTDIFSETELESIQNNDFVDWEEELLQTGFVNSQSLGLSGGTDFTKVYASLNYFKEDGLIPTSSYTRRNLRLNVDQKITDRISTRFDLNLLNYDTERAANVNVITFSPLGDAFDDDGEITRFPSGEEGTGTNPLWNLRESNDNTKGNDFVINVIPTFQIAEGLSYTLKGSMTRRNSERTSYLSSLHSSGMNTQGRARIDNQLREAYLVENIINYDKEFNSNNKFNLTLVQAVDEIKVSRTQTEGTGFINETLGANGITDAIGNVSVFRDQSTIRTASFMGRARYNLLNRYLFTATFRADGASVNAADFKWTNNPAAAFAWKIHNEPFFQNVKQVEQLKLRLSYGSLANALSRPYTSLFTANGEQYIFDGQTASGYSPSTVLPNVNLRHETITTFNLGMDFSIFKQLLTGSVEYYVSTTKDLLLRRGVPSTTGYQFTYFNAGEVENRGVELSITANIINTQDFKWSVSTNWSNNRNEIIELYNDGDGSPILRDDTYGYYVGQSSNVLRQYQFDGIWQEGDDFETAPQANENSTNPQENLAPGDIRIADVNGVDEDGNMTAGPDGRITPEDQVFIESNPDWFGSLSSVVSYKGFSLLVDFYAVEGATKVNPFLSDFNNGGTLSSKLNGVEVPYYTPENPSTTFPRPNFDAAPQYLNALAVKDASYIRLRSISLGYTVPKNTIPKIGEIKVYVTATNVFTQTDYIGYSPEVNIRSTFSNADTGYPDARVFTVGLKANL